jgi:hypothetical protein
MTRAQVFSILSVAALVACGSNESRPSGLRLGGATAASAGSGGAAGAGGTGGAAGGSGGAAGEGGTSASTGVGGAGGEGSFGDLPVDEVADGPCVATTSTPVTLYPASSSPIPFDRLARVGARWLASETLSNGFVTFDLDGANPTPTPTTVAGDGNLAASEGATVGAIGVTEQGSLLHQRYAPDLSPLGAPVPIANELPTSLALGGGDGASLVVWGAPGVLRARGVDASGALAGPAFDFGEGTVGDYFRAAVAPSSGGVFAIAWTGDSEPGTHETHFATATLTGVVTTPTRVLESTSQHRVSFLARASTGYVLLLDATIEGSSNLLVRLDDDGHVVGRAKRLLGALYGWQVAVNGDAVAIVAKRASGEAELRVLDASLEPKSPWICVTGPSDELFHEAAVAADGAGFAVVARTPEGAEVLHRVDVEGSPAP